MSKVRNPKSPSNRRFARKFLGAAAVLASAASAVVGVGVSSASAADINVGTVCGSTSLAFQHQAGNGYWATGEFSSCGKINVIDFIVKENGVVVYSADSAFGSAGSASTQTGHFTPARGAAYQVEAVFYQGGQQLGYATSGSPQVLAN
jgi:hypothetical protein